MANVDIIAEFEQIVLVATRVEKRLGALPDKKKKSRSFDTITDLDSDSKSESDDVEAKSEEKLDFNSSERKKKKKKLGKSPSFISKDGKKEHNKSKEDDHQFLKRLKRLGFSPPVSPEKPFCVICDRAGHATENCWYNPNCRGKIPPHIQRNFQSQPPQANQVMPAPQGRGYNQGPRNAPPRKNWQRPQN